ncbi:MAG: hypothetical protein JW956_03450 [Calditrichaceae bacterium]|nr:hypothetical protein [Calditrichaceae bacterium]
MRHLLFIVLPLFLISFACFPEKQDKANMKADKQMMEMDHSVMQKADSMQMVDEKIIYYTCPMEAHKAVHSDKPSKCPECGMALVAGVITSVEDMEYYGCPMLIHSHVRSDKPGECAECGMALKPMRLKEMKDM